MDSTLEVKSKWETYIQTYVYIAEYLATHSPVQTSVSLTMSDDSHMIHAFDNFYSSIL